MAGQMGLTCGATCWAVLDLNQRPLPCQFKDSPRSKASASLWSAVTVSLMGWLCGGVAVTSAVRDHLLRSNGRTVQTCPGVAVLWGDVPGLSSFVGSGHGHGSTFGSSRRTWR
jgi:hypothetical protein